MTTKQCSKCKEVKPLSEFYKQPGTKDGLCGHCKECKLAYQAGRKEIIREKGRERRYGLDGINFQLLWDTQRGRCGICETPLEHTQQGMHVDHNHSTGEVRGLLCSNCNLGLGHFKDNTAYLQAAITYLG